MFIAMALSANNIRDRNITFASYCPAIKATGVLANKSDISDRPRQSTFGQSLQRNQRNFKMASSNRPIFTVIALICSVDL